MKACVEELEEAINISNKEMVSIPWEEYKELLMIKGRYEEIKEQNTNKVNWRSIDWVHHDSTTVPIKELNNPISRYVECPPIAE